jgi:hypothetical protein
MIMKVAVGLLTLLFATSAFAQSAPPKAVKKPAAQAKPQAPMGCKLVGTVKGTKLWAGDSVAASELRGAAPMVDTAPASPPDQGAIPPGQKE